MLQPGLQPEYLACRHIKTTARCKDVVVVMAWQCAALRAFCKTQHPVLPQAWWSRLRDMWLYGGERDECGYLHEALPQESFEPERTQYYIRTCKLPCPLCFDLP